MKTNIHFLFGCFAYYSFCINRVEGEQKFGTKLLIGVKYKSHQSLKNWIVPRSKIIFWRRLFSILSIYKNNACSKLNVRSLNFADNQTRTRLFYQKQSVRDRLPEKFQVCFEVRLQSWKCLFIMQFTAWRRLKNFIDITSELRISRKLT